MDCCLAMPFPPLEAGSLAKLAPPPSKNPGILIWLAVCCFVLGCWPFMTGACPEAEDACKESPEWLLWATGCIGNVELKPFGVAVVEVGMP